MFELIFWPDEILQKEAEEVRDFSEIKDVSDKMFETMVSHDGIGLAAPQIGLSKKLFVMNVDGNKRVVINPVIHNKYGLFSIEEGCLSFPTVRVKVDRAAIIDVEYRNVEGNVMKESLNNLNAICFQHEFDHLNGVTFVDYLSESTKKVLMKKYARKRYRC